MAQLGSTKFKNGHWVWNPIDNALQFVSNAYADGMLTGNTHGGNIVQKTTSRKKSQIEIAGCMHAYLYFKFHESIAPLEQIRFRRYLQRTVEPNEPEVVTVQDIRDVVLLTIPLEHLNKQYIQFVHTNTMDFLIRTLIIYFQLYVQVWEELLRRRRFAISNIPLVGYFTTGNRRDLADTRSMVGRAYLTLLAGIDDSKPFHHFSRKNNCTQAEKDVRLHEFLIPFCSRSVWIALLKRNYNLIEQEMHSLFRSNSFNIITHRNRVQKGPAPLPHERSILYGRVHEIKECRLMQHSLPVKEMVYEMQDFRMLGTGCAQFKHSDPRIKYMEIAYAAPEELLSLTTVPVGILGILRNDFDTMLSLRFARNDDGTLREFHKFKLPPIGKTKASDIPDKYPNHPPLYDNSVNRAEGRKVQCRKWIAYINKHGNKNKA